MKLMLVDDEALLLNALRRVLLRRFDDIDVHTFPDAQSALTALDDDDGYDLLLTDMRMPGMNGAQLLEAAEKRRPDLVRIVLSGQMDESSRQRASQHAHDILTKPVHSDVLSDTVRRAGELRRLLNDPIVRGAAGALPSSRHADAEAAGDGSAACAVEARTAAGALPSSRHADAEAAGDGSAACAVEPRTAAGASGAAACAVETRTTPPAPPPAFGALVRRLDRRTSVDDVAALVDEDAALSAKVMALASTAPFDGGLGAAAAPDTASAVRRIGLLALKAIVLFASLRSSSSLLPRARSVDLDELSRAAEARALAAACVAARRRDDAAAGVGAAAGDVAGDVDVGARYAAALLVDIGRLVTCATSPAAVDAVADAVRNGTHVDDAERAFLGATHREIGAYLLGVFCLPLPVIEAVRTPTRTRTAPFEAAA